MKNQSLITLDSIECLFRVRQGRFRYRKFAALKNISLSINKGETLGIIGRNGSGKSTLLRIINGIYLPNRGEVVYHEKINISLLSLQAGFDPELPGTMNAVLSAMFLGFTKKQASAKLESIIQFSELGAWIHEPIKTYSTGMRARLGFAVAIEMSPDVLLIDEVLGVGDQSFRDKSMNAMKEKIKSEMTIVFVSHSLSSVRELCDRVAWLDQGEIQMVGGVDRVIKLYQEESQTKINKEFINPN